MISPTSNKKTCNKGDRFNIVPKTIKIEPIEHISAKDHKLLNIVATPPYTE